MELKSEQTVAQCAHCRTLGEVGTGLFAKENWFCCRGCEAVYGIIRANNLEKFYELRTEELGVRAPELDDLTLDVFNSEKFLKSWVVQIGARSKVTFGISEMHCPACVWLLEKLPRISQGIFAAHSNFAEKSLEVRFDPQVLSAVDVAREILRIGYTPTTPGGKADTTIRDLYVKLAVAAFGAMNTMMLSVSLYQGDVSGIEERYRLLLEWASLVIAAPVVLYSGIPFYRRGLLGLLKGVIHIDLPLSLGIFVGFVASVASLVFGSTEVYFDSLCMLICLLLVGQVLQAEALKRARFGAEASWALLPKLARTRQGVVAIEKVRAGDLLIVEDGEIFPVDGVVEAGESAINKAVITGEAVPEPIYPGSRVVGGGVNYGAVVEMRALSDAATSQLSLLESAVRGSSRSKLSQIVDLVSRRFVQVVLSAAMLTFVGWWCWGDVKQGVMSTVSLLVVTCPCALGLAIPLAIRVALSRARARGILIKDEAALETISKIKKVYFDKTGTLTEPTLTVTKLWHSPEISESQVAELVWGLEAGVKNHPIAESLRRYAQKTVRTEARVANFTYTPGSGVRGQIDGADYSISALTSAERAHGFSGVLESEATGKSCLALRKGAEVLAVFAIYSRLRSDARPACDALRALGREVCILSGDSASAVQAAASELKVNGYVGFGVTPDNKAAKVGSDSMMVGDGVNDLLALRSAAVGVGISGGVTASMSASSVYLRSGALSDVVTLVRGADDTMRVVRRSLLFSVLYNLITGGAAMLGYINPFIAAILMPFSSLSVISISNFNRVFLR